MKLAHPDMHFTISISEDRFPLLILERSDIFQEYILQLCRQAEGSSGPFVLSDNWIPIDMGKSTFVLTDLFHIELNGRQQTTALIKYLNSMAVSEQHIQNTLSLQEVLFQWIVDLETDLPFAVIHNTNIDISAVMKAMGIRFDDETENLSEKICSLIRICAAYLKTRLLIIVGLHDVMDPEELEIIYKTAMYEKLPILSIERHQPLSTLAYEQLYLIDRDLCEIYNDPEPDIP